MDAFNWKNMKVAILTPTFSHFSGIDRVVELQAEELNKKGHDVRIVCLKAEMKSKFAKIIQLGIPKSSFIERVNRLFFFLDREKINKGVEAIKDCDLAIAHLYPMTIIAAKAKKYGVKFRYHNHGVADPELFETAAERNYMKLFNKLSNRYIRNCDEVVSISNYLKKILKKETGINSRIEYDKIDPKRFNKNTREKYAVEIKRLRQKYPKIVFFVGRLSPHKGVDLLIKTFKKVLEKNPHAYLLIGGKQTFSGYGKKLLKMSNDHIIFLGQIPDEKLQVYYAAADVYATATLWEGFNMTIAEANACGTPVVAFDIGPHKEVIKKGVLVKPKNVEEFANQINKFLISRRI